MERFKFLKVSLKLLSVSTLLAIILVSPAFAEVTFVDEEAARLIVEVEQNRLCKEMYQAVQKTNEELVLQSQLSRGEIDERIGQVEVCKKALEAKDLILKTQSEDCEKLMAAAKGSFWSRLKSNFGVFGTGALSGVLVAALLVLLL